MAFTFEKLIVYQKAVNFADQIACSTERFPRGFYFLGDQLNRASLSIAANIGEKNGPFTMVPPRRTPELVVWSCCALADAAHQQSGWRKVAPLSSGSECSDTRPGSKPHQRSLRIRARLPELLLAQAIKAHLVIQGPGLNAGQFGRPSHATVCRSQQARQVGLLDAGGHLFSHLL
jgi:hypothetical protein